MQTPTQKTVQTKYLDVATEISGPENGRAVILLHGWPDDLRTWDRIVPALNAAGWRTIVPSLRGFGATRFRDGSTMRSGQLSALGQDVIDLAAAMGLGKFALIGHDWGARAAYIAASQLPQQVTHCVALSVGYGTNDPKQKLSFRQTRNYWYHWYMGLDLSSARIAEERRDFTKFLWQTWSPAWPFSDEEFQTTANSFDNPDWAGVTVHSYRHRWGLAASDPAYDALEKALNPAPPITVPTLMIHGGADACNDPSTSTGRESFFQSRYDRVVIDGVGHFPQREAADAVTYAVLPFLSE